MTRLAPERMGNRLLGGHRWTCSVARCCASPLVAGGMISALRYVQRAGHELLASAPCHGSGRNAAADLWQTASSNARTLGGDSGMRHGVGLCLNLGFERLVTIDILLYGTSLAWSLWRWSFAHSRAGAAARLSSSRRNAGCGFYRSCPDLAARIFGGPQRERTSVGMSSLAFGMVLIGAGVVAYLANHTWKPEGWTAPRRRSPDPPLKKTSPRIFAD